jgi:hypothetical protein
MLISVTNYVIFLATVVLTVRQLTVRIPTSHAGIQCKSRKKNPVVRRELVTSGYPYSSNKQTEEAGATKSLRVPQPHDLTWLFVVDQLQSAGLRIVSSPEDTKVGAAQCVLFCVGSRLHPEFENDNHENDSNIYKCIYHVIFVLYIYLQYG